MSPLQSSQMASTLEVQTEKVQASKPATSSNPGDTDKFSLASHLSTIWLFTYSDLVSMVYPESAFGIFSALSGPLLTTNQSPRLSSILLRLPYTVLWVWLNLLLFCVANQRLPDSIGEDAINKPWRPLPSKRYTPQQARRLLLVLIPTVCIAAHFLGGANETVILIVLTWYYNDLKASDEGICLRNFVNALGFMGYSAGAAKVACGPGLYDLNGTATYWLIIMSMMIFTTMHVQDMYDQEGDAARGRITMPLVLGDWTARWTIAAPVAVWSLVCPLFWEVDAPGYVFPVVLGGTVIVRTLSTLTPKADRLTFKFWCFWVISLYSLPVVKNHSVFYRF
ncbi:MAG: hypothetical protein FRX48_00456 [Lasallia pustulata]|uniref:UbiA prenyltransferase family n=1 Tax=Lasallia pustulata TaxID=136370 RepID=A0A5M8Q0X9_9LECA|nr:MAG: hypothetical protein FRX48_00456 [Lasallia pustulata]